MDRPSEPTSRFVAYCCLLFVVLRFYGLFNLSRRFVNLLTLLLGRLRPPKQFQVYSENLGLHFVNKQMFYSEKNWNKHWIFKMISTDMCYDGDNLRFRSPKIKKHNKEYRSWSSHRHFLGEQLLYCCTSTQCTDKSASSWRPSWNREGMMAKWEREWAW